MPNRETINRTQIADLGTKAITADGGSDYVDIQGFDAVKIVIVAGTTGGSGSNTLTCKLQHADDTPSAAGSYSDVPDTQQHGGPFVIDDDDVIGQIAYVGNKRYLRVAYTEVGTISGPVSILAIGAYPARGSYPEPSTFTTGSVS